MVAEWGWLDELLYGIDMDEGEDEQGWWETSTGAEFGARKLADLKAAIRARERDVFIAGYGACYEYSDDEIGPAFDRWKDTTQWLGH